MAKSHASLQQIRRSIFAKKQYWGQAQRWLQSSLYFGLAGVLIALLVPWSALSMTTISIGVGSLVALILVGWSSYRHHQLQRRIQKLEMQVRSMQAKRLQTITPQALAHLEVEEFFTDSQTKH